MRDRRQGCARRAGATPATYSGRTGGARPAAQTTHVGPREPASRSRPASRPADAYCPAARCADPRCVRQLLAWGAERHRAALPHGRSCGVWHVARLALPATLPSTDRALLTRSYHAHRLQALGSVRLRQPNAAAADASEAQGQREGLTGEGAPGIHERLLQQRPPAQPPILCSMRVCTNIEWIYLTGIKALPVGMCGCGGRWGRVHITPRDM